jgi:short-subunit dehydrogenase
MKKLVLLLVNVCIMSHTFPQPGVTGQVSVADTSGIFSGDYALVAGGSKGIGYAIAEALARRRYNLILIARHPDSLQAAKKKLESAYHIQVELLVNDLSREQAADEIAHWCTTRDIPLKMLCNVAGAGGERDYLSLSLDTLRYMAKVKCRIMHGAYVKITSFAGKKRPFLYFKCGQSCGPGSYSC